MTYQEIIDRLKAIEERLGHIADAGVKLNRLTLDTKLGEETRVEALQAIEGERTRLNGERDSLYAELEVFRVREIWPG